MKRWQLLELKGKFCNPIDPAILHGPVAEARCGLAEVENNRVVLARDLPMVIAYHEARLKIIDTLRKTGAYEPEETEEERAMRKELRQVQKRLDAVEAEVMSSQDEADPVQSRSSPCRTTMRFSRPSSRTRTTTPRRLIYADCARRAWRL